MDWTPNLLTILGLCGASFAFFFNSAKERKASELQTKKGSYETFFADAEAYSASLRVRAFDKSFSTSDQFIRYEAAKAKMAFYASAEVITKCAAYDRALRSYRSALEKVHREELKEEKDRLVEERDKQWRTMQAARKSAIHRAACEVGAHEATEVNEELVHSLFGGKSVSVSEK